MSRRSILDVIEDIKKILSNGKEMSVKRISEKIKSQWETTIKALEFMKDHGMVKERKNDKTERVERLFSLVKSSS
jgi:Mn-dependent DtxR family transcriptional regulator